MSKLSVAIIVSALTGAAVAGLVLYADDYTDNARDAEVLSDRGYPERLERLESALEGEREARQLLEDEVFRLIDEIATLQAGKLLAPQNASSPAAESRLNSPTEISRVDNSRRRGQPQDRAEQLVNAGFSDDRASFIARREAELRLEAMQARFEASRNGDDVGFRDAAMQADRELRTELGALEYEQYLEASNRATSVGINAVMELSPAAQAGLQRGDQIVRYNGERVYNVFELNQLQLQASDSETVRVDILRDGAPMQLQMPQGPLGIQANRGRRR